MEFHGNAGKTRCKLERRFTPCFWYRFQHCLSGRFVHEERSRRIRITAPECQGLRKGICKTLLPANLSITKPISCLYRLPCLENARSLKRPELSRPAPAFLTLRTRRTSAALCRLGIPTPPGASPEAPGKLRAKLPDGERTRRRDLQLPRRPRGEEEPKTCEQAAHDVFHLFRCCKSPDKLDSSTWLQSFFSRVRVVYPPAALKPFLRGKGKTCASRFLIDALALYSLD